MRKLSFTFLIFSNCSTYIRKLLISHSKSFTIKTSYFLHYLVIFFSSKFPKQSKRVLIKVLTCLFYYFYFSISFPPFCIACWIMFSVTRSTWFVAFSIKKGVILLNNVRPAFTVSQPVYVKSYFLSQPPIYFLVFLVFLFVFSFLLNFSFHIVYNW